MFGFSLFLLMGVIVGVLAGLLGIGGGIIMVPFLAYIFNTLGMPQALLMHMAESTALATLAITTFTAVIVQQKKKNIRWDIFRSLSFSIIPGTVLGALVASFLPNHVLKILFGLFVSVIAIHLFFNQKQPLKEPEIKQRSRRWVEITAGFVIGIIAGMLGIGGGIFIVPLLLRFGLTAHNATATSVACACLLSIVGTISYIATGWNVADLPQGTTGFVYWPAVLGMGLASIFFVPLGTKLASLLSGKALIRIFAIFLFIVGLMMLLS